MPQASPMSIGSAAGNAAWAAALRVPGVAGLHSGRVGEVALLLPGERIEGIKPSRSGELLGLEVHIVFDASSGLEIHGVAEAVRAAVADAAEFDFVDVVVADAVATAGVAANPTEP